MGDSDALHAARAVLAGRPVNPTTDEIFALLESDFHIPARERIEARRVLEAMHIGNAVEAVEKAGDRQARLLALLNLARALSRQMKDRRAGWFRFLVAFGSQRGESSFQLSVVRRPHSARAKPRQILNRATETRQAVGDMLVAGAILSRVEAANASGVAMTLKAATEAAINDGEIATDEEAARKSFQRFRKSCAQLNGGGDTCRLEQYAGPMKNYRGRWVAVPDTGGGLIRLPSEKGGRPTT